MMRWQTIFTWLLGLMLICTSSFASAPVSDSLAPMIEKVSPAVVNIKADIKITDLNLLLELQKRYKSGGGGGGGDNGGFDPNTATLMSVASGVIIDPAKGYILTNAHVVADAQTITVTLNDGRHYTAKLIGMDKPSDVALLEIKGKNLTGITMGDSNTIKVGDPVTAIGNPFGLNQSVTSGIISALGRTSLGIEGIENFIQTDASINPGNSGGALLNKAGELIGINTAILAPARGNIGIGFAIPINMAKSIMAQLLQYGDVKRGMLGIGAQNITPDLATALNVTSKSGAAVTQVLPLSPAQQAGIQVGDIITSINSNAIKNASDVVNTVGFLRVNSKANVTVLRNKKSVNLSVNLADPKKRHELEAQNDPFLYGVGLGDFAQYSPVHGQVQGVAVTSVDRDSNAWHSDLRPGDVITGANQDNITNAIELRNASAKAGNTLLLRVLRGVNAFFLVITKET